MSDTVKSPLVLAGRVLLAAMFVLSGFGKLGNLEGTAGYIASGGLPAPSVLAVLVGAFEVVAGLALAVGFKARWAALALGVFTLLASVLFHAYWSVPADQQFVQQLLFMKNLAIAGGMFVVASLGAGGLSVDARLRAAEQIARCRRQREPSTCPLGPGVQCSVGSTAGIANSRPMTVRA